MREDMVAVGMMDGDRNTSVEQAFPRMKVEEDEKEDNVEYEPSLEQDAEGLDEEDSGEADLNEVQDQVHGSHARCFWMSQLEIVVHSSDPRTVCLDRQLVVLLVKNQRQQSMRRVQNYQSCDVVDFEV